MDANSFKISIVQYDIDKKSEDNNFKTIQKLLDQSKHSPNLILLPEMFNTGFSSKPGLIASSMKGKAVKWMQNIAGKMNAVVAGSVVINENSKYFNRLISVFPNGQLEWYNKRHLFRMGGEDEFYTQGEERKIITINDWKFALFVCYDLRFPVWSRNMNDYDVALFAANWPSARNSVWETLLKARAIENQSYVLGINRVGMDELGEYSGNSMVVDFKGNVMDSLGNGVAGLVETTLLKGHLNDFRKAFPAWMDADKFSISIK